MPNEIEKVEGALEPVNPFQLVIQGQPGSPLQSNIPTVKANVEALVAQYTARPVNNDDDYRIAKAQRTEIRGLTKDIEAQRKDWKKAYLEPIRAFEEQVKDLEAPLAQIDGLISASIDGFDERRKAERTALLADAYARMVPDIAIPTAGQKTALVDFARIFDARWTNRSMTYETAKAELETKVSKILADEKALAATQVTHRDAVNEAFWRTLSVDAALAKDKAMTEAEAKQRALDEARAKRNAAQPVATKVAQVTPKRTITPAPATAFAWRIDIPSADQPTADRIARLVAGCGVACTLTCIGPTR